VHDVMAAVGVERWVAVVAQVAITPNDTGLPGIASLRTIVGAMMTVGLVMSVFALLASAVMWGLGSNSSNPHLAGRGKVGVLVACGAAVLCGASVTLVNFFWGVGQAVS
jgi:hypothetical protein